METFSSAVESLLFFLWVLLRLSLHWVKVLAPAGVPRHRRAFVAANMRSCGIEVGEREARFSFGMAGDEEFKGIGVPLGSTIESCQIKKVPGS